MYSRPTRRPRAAAACFPHARSVCVPPLPLTLARVRTLATMFRMLEAPRFSGTLASALAADKSTSTSSRHSATLEGQLVARGLAWRDAS
ncbi:MAG: hypothetical protein EOO41_02295, partial [Methanobacteriota archaeon]